MVGWLCCFGDLLRVHHSRECVQNKAAHLLAARKQKIEAEEGPGAKYLLQGYVPNNLTSSHILNVPSPPSSTSG
jgi:hypothetical protein